MQVLFEPLSGMKGLILRHQNLLSICPEFEYNNQNGNLDPQHSTKLIDVTHVLAIHLNAKTNVFRINDLRYKFYLWERVKSEASKFLLFCPESEYNNQNGNFDPQHSTKLIDVTHVFVFHRGIRIYCQFVLNPIITIKMGTVTHNTQQN